MTKKTKNGIVVAAVAVVFYLTGSFVGWPNANTGLWGNIGKANKYNKSVVKIDVDALQEKLQNDTSYCNQMLASAGLMQVHADQFCALLEYSQQQFGSNKEFAQSQAAFEQVKETALNAQEAIAQFAADMGQLADGKRVRSFEQDYNNAILAFNLLQQSSKVADIFVADADTQIVKNISADNTTLAALRNEWCNFALANAILHADELRLRQVESLGLLVQSQLEDGTLSATYGCRFITDNNRLSDTFLPTLDNKNQLNIVIPTLDGKAQLDMLSEEMSLQFQDGCILNRLLLSSEVLAGSARLLDSPLAIHFVNELMISNQESIRLVQSTQNSADIADAIDNHAKLRILSNLILSSQLVIRDISLYESGKLSLELLSENPSIALTSGFSAFTLFAQGNISLDNLSLRAPHIGNSGSEQLSGFWDIVIH